jgi:hypothetical protein
MSSGLHVDFAQTQNKVEALSTLEPDVDSARSQRGLFIRGKEPRVPNSEETLVPEFGRPPNSEGDGQEEEDGIKRRTEEELIRTKTRLATSSADQCNSIGVKYPCKAVSPSREGSTLGEMPRSEGAALEEVRDVVEEIERCTRLDVLGMLRRSRPASPLVTQKQDQIPQIDVKETSAPDSDRSGPGSDQGKLIKTIEGMQHALRTLTQGIKHMISEKARARKDHARREPRRAARQQEVGDQPSRFPVDSPLGLQQDVSTADIGIKPAEAGTQPQTEDWAPPETET